MPRIKLTFGCITLLLILSFLIWAIWSAQNLTIRLLSILGLISLMMAVEITIERNWDSKYRNATNNDLPLEFGSDAKTIGSHNLTLVAAMLAAMSFLLTLTSQKPDVEGPILIVSYGFSLIFISYLLTPMIKYADIVQQVQRSFQFYGILCFTTGLTFAYGIFLPQAAHYLFTVPLAGLMVHFLQLWIHYKEVDSRSLSKQSVTETFYR